MGDTKVQGGKAGKMEAKDWRVEGSKIGQFRGYGASPPSSSCFLLTSPLLCHTSPIKFLRVRSATIQCVSTRHAHYQRLELIVPSLQQHIIPNITSETAGLRNVIRKYWPTESKDGRRRKGGVLRVNQVSSRMAVASCIKS